MTATAWMSIGIVGFSLAGILLIVAVFLFVKLNILSVIGDLTGKTVARDVKSTKNQSKTQRSTPSNYYADNKQSKNGPQYKANANHSVKQEKTVVTTQGTAVIANNQNTMAKDTVVLSDEQPTSGKDTVVLSEEQPAHGKDTVVLSDEQPTPGKDTVVLSEEQPTPGKDTVVLSEEQPTPGKDTVVLSDEQPTPGKGTVVLSEETDFMVTRSTIIVHSNEIVGSL